MTDTEQIFQAPRPAAEASSLLGLFADEPELVDEVCRMAMKARRRDPLRTGVGEVPVADWTRTPPAASRQTSWDVDGWSER